jgi:hypothetical protein
MLHARASWRSVGWIAASAFALGCGAPPAKVEPATVQIATAPAASAAPSATSADRSAGEGGTSVLAALKHAAASRQKTDECDALIQPINAAVDALEKSPSSKAANADPSADLLHMAKVMDDAVRELDAKSPTIPELVAGRAAYRKMAIDVAAAAREMAAAATAKDVAKITTAQAHLERATAQEDAIVNRINAFCQAP